MPRVPALKTQVSGGQARGWEKTAPTSRPEMRTKIRFVKNMLPGAGSAPVRQDLRQIVNYLGANPDKLREEFFSISLFAPTKNPSDNQAKKDTSALGVFSSRSGPVLASRRQAVVMPHAGRLLLCLTPAGWLSGSKSRPNQPVGVRQDRARRRETR